MTVFQKIMALRSEMDHTFYHVVFQKPLWSEKDWIVKDFLTGTKRPSAMTEC